MTGGVVDVGKEKRLLPAAKETLLLRETMRGETRLGPLIDTRVGAEEVLAGT